jgi:ATP-dependent helicase/nuclease subunit A
LSRIQREYVQEERRHDEREDANLLYVAMTRARQALIVSGCEGQGLARSWYPRVRAAVAAARGEADAEVQATPLVYGDDLAVTPASDARLPTTLVPIPAVSLPPAVLPTGSRSVSVATPGQRHGTLFHRVMEWMTGAGGVELAAVTSRLGIAAEEARRYIEDARRVIAAPQLRCYFDERLYLRAFNELSVVSASGEVRRLDRVVELAAEAWVLDYKTGQYDSIRGTPLENEYCAQVAEYCAAMRGVFRGKPVRGALIFSDGRLVEVSA